MNKWQYINNQWTGMIVGGIIGLFLIIMLSNYINSSYEYINQIVTINIITLIIIFCITYLTVFKLGKNSKILKRIHLIIFNLIIGAVFGLFVGLMSYQGEIYWFVFGFIILSLIPIVNMSAVVFWLGAIICTLYFPEILIPIFNDFLPIKLVDGSFRDTTGLPLFIFPIFVFLGYLIPVSVTKSINKKKLATSKTAEEKELKNEMNKYESILNKWESEGYDITLLREKQKNSNLKVKIQNLRDYESKIEKLKQFKKELQQMDLKEFDYDIISIKKKFKNPYKVDEIESDLQALKNRIELKIENLVEKTDDEIKNAISNAYKAKNSKQLNFLKILQEDLLKYSKDLDSNKISYKDSMNQIKELYNKAKKPDVPPEEKNETQPETYNEIPNYYEILNIKPNATQNQIKKMFKRLSLAFHPDTEEDTGVDGDRKYRMIMQAYDTLKDPDKRKKYDEEIGIKK